MIEVNSLKLSVCRRAGRNNQSKTILGSLCIIIEIHMEVHTGCISSRILVKFPHLVDVAPFYGGIPQSEDEDGLHISQPIDHSNNALTLQAQTVALSSRSGSKWSAWRKLPALVCTTSRLANVQL